MNKLALLFCVLIYISFTHGQEQAPSCSATVAITQRAGVWEEDHMPKHIFDVRVTNTHASCTIRDSISISLYHPAGTHVGQTWGMSASSITIGTLTPGQSHYGPGLVLAGVGAPTISINAYPNCQCDGGLNPQQPTNAPTAAPTEPPVSTPEPTDAPATQAPTSPPPTHAPGDGTFYRVGLKFLILTCNKTDARLTVAKNTLNAVGSQYDVIDQPTWGAADLQLTNTDGSGKYYGIISTIELFCWSSAQKITLEAYEQNFHVKTVILYSYPYASNGVSAAGGAPITSTSAYLTFAPAVQLCTKSLHYDAHIPITGVYAYQTSIIDPVIATPALYLNDGSTKYIAAAIIHYSNGRERMEFYVDQATWALYPVLLGTAWLQWASNGIFAGARRIEFNAHMDDIFMSTGMFDPSTGQEGETEIYRMTPEDMEATATWQTSVNSHLPSGSNFTLTFPFNGQTVKEKGGYATDPLYLKAVQLRDHFIWESHTYSHPYLDNYTYAQVKSEYSKNEDTAKELFPGAPLSSFPNYCSKSTITPSITGLFNGDALRAMHDQGFKFVVGDNSRPELIPSNLYHTQHTTVAINGFDGMIIIPRHATNIFYDGSRVSDIVTEFNYHYSAALGGDRTFEQIMQGEVNNAVASLLAFRHDPFMFHQANLRQAGGFPDGNTHSLLSYWVDSVIAELSKFSSLPVRSSTHDDLGQMYLDREDRDSCGFQAMLKVEHGSNGVVGATVQSTGACKFGISGVSASGAQVSSVERYGSEQTLWLDMTPGCNYDVTFTDPVYPL